jgi:hypothetical protein
MQSEQEQADENERRWLRDNVDLHVIEGKPLIEKRRTRKTAGALKIHGGQ